MKFGVSFHLQQFLQRLGFFSKDKITHLFPIILPTMGLVTDRLTKSRTTLAYTYENSLGILFIIFFFRHVHPAFGMYSVPSGTLLKGCLSRENVTTI